MCVCPVLTITSAIEMTFNDVVSVMIRRAVLVQYGLVTDRQAIIYIFGIHTDAT